MTLTFSGIPKSPALVLLPIVAMKCAVLIKAELPMESSLAESAPRRQRRLRSLHSNRQLAGPHP